MEYIGDWMLHDMAEAGSTNDEVKKLSANIRGQKVVISARSQTNGRGRRGRGWVSLDGNLFFSLGVENCQKLGPAAECQIEMAERCTGQ